MLELLLVSWCSFRTPSTSTFSLPQSTLEFHVAHVLLVVSTRHQTWTWKMSPKTPCSVLAKWRTSPGSRCSTSQHAPSVDVVSQCAQRGQPVSLLARSFSSWDFVKTCSPQLTDFFLEKAAATLQHSFQQQSTQTFSGRAQHVVRVLNSAQ